VIDVADDGDGLADRLRLHDQVMPLSSTIDRASVQCGMSSLLSGLAGPIGQRPSSLSLPPKDSLPPKPLLSGGRLPFGRA
jgi:hypothetical protein